MDDVELTAAANGSPGCRCRDVAAIMLADLAGEPHSSQGCPTHSEAGRREVEREARVRLLDANAQLATSRAREHVALNAPALETILLAAFAGEPDPTEDPNPPRSAA